MNKKDAKIYLDEIERSADSFDDAIDGSIFTDEIYALVDKIRETLNLK